MSSTDLDKIEYLKVNTTAEMAKDLIKNSNIETYNDIVDTMLQLTTTHKITWNLDNLRFLFNGTELPISHHFCDCCGSEVQTPLPF